MKKVFALVLALVLVLGLAACGDKDKKIENPNLITIGDHHPIIQVALSLMHGIKQL